MEKLFPEAFLLLRQDNLLQLYEEHIVSENQLNQNVVNLGDLIQKMLSH